jgi:fused signal recognition particle receptor
MFRKLNFLGLILLLGALLIGAFLRIADAGLGCPAWPGCYGEPVVDEQSAAMMAAVGGKALQWLWLGWVQLYLGGAFGILVLALIAMVWRLPVHRVRAASLLAVLLLLAGAQAGLGLWGHYARPPPLVSAAHVFTGFLTLACAYWLYLGVKPGVDEAAARGAPGLRLLARLGLVLLLAEIALGGWTSAQHAGLACPDFPTCLGQPWPEVDWRRGFTLWPNIAADYAGGVLPAEARAAIHFAHRLGAVAVFLVLSLLAVSASSNRNAAPVSKPAVLLSFLLLLQIGLGVLNVLLRLPVAVAVAHSAVAALLLLNLVHINVYLRRRLPEAAAVPEAAPARPPVEAAPPPRPETLFERLRGQLGKTRGGLTGLFAVLGRGRIDRELLEEIEEQLLMADVGVNVTREIVADLGSGLEKQELAMGETLRNRLRGRLLDIVRPCSVPLVIPPEVRPFVILVVGVNGVGKTTTIGKLARRLQNQGHSVMLAAGDTFRAAAIEQLQTWGERNKIAVIAQHSGADSASVIYDAVEAAQARGVDVLIADTAGRLHTKSNLMEELSKIKRIIGRLDETAPHEVLLVLDAGTGQNAMSQARLFNEAVGLTGLALTKLDGTAKGGVIFALARQFGIPIRFIGIGEGIDDLRDFDAIQFIDALFAEDEASGTARLH